MAASLIKSEFKYGDANYLQNLAIWETPTEAAPEGNQADFKAPKYWLVYIHGGAWRDPTEDLYSIEPTINKLLAAHQQQSASLDAAALTRIVGFASINYRLSPHPDHPQDRATTPASQLRDARHPDHILDVAAALSFLAGIRPGCLERYILFGHSCGASLAFQLLMSSPVSPASSPLQLPLDSVVSCPSAVVGFQGIYDLRGLNERKGGAYTELFAVPFGPDEAVWDSVSPARYRGVFGGSGADGGAELGAGEQEGVEKKLLAVVAHSPEDELVDVEEQVAMEQALRETGVQFLSFSDLRGKHQEVREDGTDMARVLLQTIATLDELESLLF